MLVDLENGHGKSQEFPFLKRMLVGDRKLNTRAKVRRVGFVGVIEISTRAKASCVCIKR